MSKAGVSPYLLLTLTPLFWSCNWVLGRALHDDVPPMALTFFRWLIASLILLPFVAGRLRRDWPTIRAHGRWLLLLGTIGIALHNATAYIALHFTTATNGVVLNSFIPVMIIAMSRLFFGERLTRPQSIGVVVSLVGVLLILSQGSWAALASLRLNVGDLAVIAAMVLWSLYTVLLRHRPAELHRLSFLLVLAGVGVAVMLPLWLGEMALGYAVAWSPQVVGALVGVALFSSVLAYIFWNRGVEQVGAQVAGMFVHLMPVFGVLLAWIFLGERLAAFHVAGIGLILTGIGITSRKGARASPAGAPDTGDGR